ncbi:MAG: hypothetical protein HKN80_00175, partial [Acidimicrobiia bacterium]|nr:hypothetical protein [Acidimicrobiia bacterium]
SVPAAAASPTHVQTLNLQAGWNAIYLEVDPAPDLYPEPVLETDPSQISQVFGSGPIAGVTNRLPAGALESVWLWSPALEVVEFVQDPADGLEAVDGWRGYFADATGTAFLTNLFGVRGNQAYLVHLNTGPHTVDVVGAPTLRSTEWVPDSFNLVGFHVDPATPPTVGSYFQYSPAHAGQPVYNLNAGGVWELMLPSTALQSGRSYWVYSEGPSGYQGPIEVVASGRAGLEFGSAIGNLDLTIFDHTGTGPSVTATHDLPTGPAVLAHWQLDVDGNTIWPPFPASYGPVDPFDGAALDVHNVPLAVRRADFPTAEIAGIIQVRDGLGSRILVPLSAATGAAGGGTPFAGAAAGAGSAYTGLWVGTAVVNAVSEVRRSVKRYCPCPGSDGTSGGSCPAANDGSISACRLAAAGDVPPSPFTPFASSPYYCPNGTDSEGKYEQEYDDFVSDPIPDAPAAGIESTITFAPATLDVLFVNFVNVGLDHPSTAELDIDLESPDGTVVRLHTGTAGDPGGNTDFFYPPVDGPGSLTDFDRGPGAGVWKLRIQDKTAGNTGSLGYWGIGFTTLDLAEEACQLIEQGNEQPVSAHREFELRVLLHCDETGTVKLLKQATIMFQEGVEGPTEATTTPGNFVLVVNDERLSEFTGSSLRDGVPVGTRVSTVAYDFDGNSQVLSGGGLGPGQMLETALTLAPTAPTNPFQHRYHPDHNVLSEEGVPFAGDPASVDGLSSPQRFEEFSIERAIRLVFDTPDLLADPEAGQDFLTGTFEETLSGLHFQDIKVQGQLELRRLSTIGTIEE